MKIGNRKLNHWLDIGVTLTYAFICAKCVVDKNPKAAFMKETILNCV